MPHRLLLSNAPNHIADGLALLGLSIMAILDSLSMSDLTGPHALLLASLVVVGVLWRNNSARDRKDELRAKEFNKATERRHSETIAMQKANSDEIKALTVSSIQANAATAESIRALTTELANRPCGMAKSKP